MWKKIKAWHIVTAIIVAILAYNMPITYQVEKTLPAVQWSKDDASVFERTEITVSGTVKLYLLKQNRFLGFVKVPGTPSTYKEDARVGSLISDEGTALNYYRPNEEVPKIYCNQMFGKFLVMPNIAGADMFSNTISAPATTREEAVEIAQKVIKPTKNFTVDWK